MLAGIVVHEDRMRANLDLTGGLIVAEAVMMAAAPKLGRQHAHDVVYGACRKAIEEGGKLADILVRCRRSSTPSATPKRFAPSAIQRTTSASAARWSTGW